MHPPNRMIRTHTIFSVPLDSLVAQSTSIQTQKAEADTPRTIIISSGRPIGPNIVSPSIQAEINPHIHTDENRVRKLTVSLFYFAQLGFITGV
jgi:hypothetical protein